MTRDGRDTRQTWLASIRQDGRYAIRNWVRRPWAFIAASGLLALAIGIATAMFTIVDALLLRPAPFKDRPARTDDRGWPPRQRGTHTGGHQGLAWP